MLPGQHWTISIGPLLEYKIPKLKKNSEHKKWKWYFCIFKNKNHTATTAYNGPWNWAHIGIKLEKKQNIPKVGKFYVGKRIYVKCQHGQIKCLFYRLEHSANGGHLKLSFEDFLNQNIVQMADAWNWILKVFWNRSRVQMGDTWNWVLKIFWNAKMK